MHTNHQLAASNVPHTNRRPGQLFPLFRYWQFRNIEYIIFKSNQSISASAYKRYIAFAICHKIYKLFGISNGISIPSGVHSCSLSLVDLFEHSAYLNLWLPNIFIYNIPYIQYSLCIRRLALDSRASLNCEKHFQLHSDVFTPFQECVNCILFGSNFDSG